MSDEREGTIRSVLSEAGDQTADVADQVKSAAEDLYGQARDSASQVSDAAGRSMKVACYTTFSFERDLDVVIPSKTSPTPPSPSRWGLDGCSDACTAPLSGCGRCSRHHTTAICKQGCIAANIAKLPELVKRPANIKDTPGPGRVKVTSTIAVAGVSVLAWTRHP